MNTVRMTLVPRKAVESMVFERAAELVDLSERVYRQVFAAGIWVATSCSAFAVGTSLLQPASSQLRGALVCTVCLVGSFAATLQPAALYQVLRRRPWSLLIPGALLGLGALVAGPDNHQLFLPIISIIGAIGIAVPRRVVVSAALIAAVGLGAPQLLYGHSDLGVAIAVIVPPLMFWLIVDRIAGFALRLHQGLERSIAATPPPDEASAAADRREAPDSPASAPRSDGQPLGLPEPSVIAVDGTRMTSRQLQVIMLICEGLKHAEIGACLDIGPQQVRRHLGQARRRTGSASTPHLVSWAHRSGLVPRSRQPGGGNPP